jgi:hypothetical protein
MSTKSTLPDFSNWRISYRRGARTNREFVDSLIDGAGTSILTRFLWSSSLAVATQDHCPRGGRGTMGGSNHSRCQGPKFANTPAKGRINRRNVSFVEMNMSFDDDISAIARIEAVPRILDIGLRVQSVTKSRLVCNRAASLSSGRRSATRFAQAVSWSSSTMPTPTKSFALITRLSCMASRAISRSQSDWRMDNSSVLCAQLIPDPRN